MAAVESLVAQMAALGFSQYEARAYCALLQKSPLNGHEVSRAAGIPPSKIYETLGRLHQKGAVLLYRSDPVLYAPVPYGDLLAGLRQRLEATMAEVQQGFADLAQEPDLGLTWSLEGTQGIVEAMTHAISRAGRRIFAALWDEELEYLAPALRAAHSRGVELQVAVYGAFALGVPHTYDLTLCGRSSQERLDGRRLAVLVRDDCETVVSELAGGGSDQAIWTENAVISLLAAEYIKEEIMGRCLINELGEERYQALRDRRPELRAMLRHEGRPHRHP